MLRQPKINRKIELRIGAKAGTSGKIFGSVNAIQIAEALKEKGFDIDRKKKWTLMVKISKNLVITLPRFTFIVI